VHEPCQQVLHDRGAPQRAWFGYSDDDAFSVGLTCGGELHVLVQRMDSAQQLYLTAAFAEVTEGRPAAVAQIVDGPDHLLGATLSILGDDHVGPGTMNSGPVYRAVTDQARALMRMGRTGRAEAGPVVDQRSDPLAGRESTSRHAVSRALSGHRIGSHAAEEVGPTGHLPHEQWPPGTRWVLTVGGVLIHPLRPVE